jgi:hypothetical protein
LAVYVSLSLKSINAPHSLNHGKIRNPGAQFKLVAVPIPRNTTDSTLSNFMQVFEALADVYFQSLFL